MAKTILERMKMDVAEWVLSKFPAQLSLERVISALEMPKKEEHGDICLPIPKLKLSQQPNALASQLAEEFTPHKSILRANSVGVFLNFAWNKKTVLDAVVSDILDKREQYGTNSNGEGKLVVIESGSPNIAKPFHAGHLRSSILGNFLKHIYQANGYKVISINYLGDWGKQYGLLAVGFNKYGDETELQKDQIRHLFDIYVKITAEAECDPAIHEEARVYFKRMEDGDKEALGLWKRFRDLSIQKYEQIYHRLNISYDVYSGESLYENGMKMILKELREKELLVESKGATIIDLKDKGLGAAMVLKSDGTTLYLTRDLAAAVGRFNEYHFYKSMYIVGSTQEYYFMQLFEILGRMGHAWSDSLSHISYGQVKAMSSRKGNVKFLEDIIEEAKIVMHGVMQSNEAKYAQIKDPDMVAETLAISAIVVQDFSSKRIKDYEFDMSRMASFEGDTGPYLQYSHARLCSIERKAKEEMDLEISGSVSLENISEDQHVLNLAMILARFPYVIEDACRTEEACVMVSYLMGLCHSLSSVLERMVVLKQPKDIAMPRLAIFVAARIVIGNGLVTLGLRPLSRM